MDRLAALTVVLAVASTAAAVGGGAWLSQSRPPVAAGFNAAASDPDPAEIERRVAALEDRLGAKPDDLPGWKMLGRSYMALGRYIDAVGAFSRAAELAPSDPEAKAALAELQAIARSRGKHDEAIRAGGAAAKP